MYSFYLPVACGMVLGGVTDASLYEKTRDICMEMGHLFQVQPRFRHYKRYGCYRRCRGATLPGAATW